MSRAFTKEDTAELPLIVARPPLPEGVPNYVTRRGMSLLREERARLEAARPAAQGGTDAATLAAHGARLSALDARIASAIVVDSSTLPADEVRFSAGVTLRDTAGHERRYRIVGVDEADPSQGRIAFTAPLARALAGKRLGDVVSLRLQHVETEYEIVGLDYTQE